MKTLDNLYKEILSSDELKAAFAEAAKEDKLEDFLKAQGCEATKDEAEVFIKEKQSQKGEISDNELEDVAGGCKTPKHRESTYYRGLQCAEDPSFYPPG